jgi:hypothetical protein
VGEQQHTWEQTKNNKEKKNNLQITNWNYKHYKTKQKINKYLKNKNIKKISNKRRNKSV